MEKWLALIFEPDGSPCPGTSETCLVLWRIQYGHHRPRPIPARQINLPNKDVGHSAMVPHLASGCVGLY
jgi:hypothetical protein